MAKLVSVTGMSQSCHEGMLSLAKGGKQVKCILIHYASNFLNEGMLQVN